MKKLPVIGITMGDPSGIGPEVILKHFSQTNFSNILTPIVIGDSGYLQKIAETLNIPIDIHSIKNIDLKTDIPKKGILVLDLKNVPLNIKRGCPNINGGKSSVEYIKKAVKLALAGKINGITTAPINKESINMAGFKYSGHTEMLADLTNTSNFAMMLWGGNLKVVLITTHVAIKDLPGLIKKDEIVRIIKLVDKTLFRWFKKRPKIGVTALNPHASDGGLFGKEEESEIIPAIKEIQEDGFDVMGPFPADSMFSEKISRKFDVIITMFHDQGLIPIKMSSFGKAVNTTLGLPFVRTSVDHGTAFDIVGKGVADPGSLGKALKVASEIIVLP